MTRKGTSSGVRQPPETDEAPETPLDEPQPIPVQDPPPTPADSPAQDPPPTTPDSPGPYVVHGEREGRDEPRRHPRTRSLSGVAATKDRRQDTATEKLLNMEENVRKAQGDE